jgi:malonate decarboxylase beta subunit
MMEKMTFEFDISVSPEFSVLRRGESCTRPSMGRHKTCPYNQNFIGNGYNQGQSVTCGVVGSGNLEVIIEKNDTHKTLFTIQTSVSNYKKIWALVIQDFVKEYQPAGLKFTLNDNGATPPVVSLRLRQAMEAFHGYQKTSKDYGELDAMDRIKAIVDPHTFEEWLRSEKTYSPHLAELDLPCEADDGIVIGSAKLKGKSILIGAQKKDFMGGAVGEIHGAKLTALFKMAVMKKVDAVILFIDSGGVRLHEANAGEISISEIIRAIYEARHQGIKTIGVVCGKNGAFGGMGITSACLDYVIINEIGRIGVSGAEVIQAVKGIEAFNAQDRGLIWRVYGGKTRYLQQIAQYYVSSDIQYIAKAIQEAMSQSSELSLDFLKKQQALLFKRAQDAGDCQEEGGYLEKRFALESRSVFDSNTQDFLKNIASKVLGAK